MPLTATSLADIRPRLRNDVVFLRVDTGIYLRSAETSCVLKGPGVYDWIAALGPRMTGEWTVADLCTGLDDARRRTAEGLLRTLLDRGFARDASASDDGGLTEPVLARFASQINFVEHFMHGDDRSPQQLFGAFRTSRVLLIGGRAGILDAAVRGLLRNGLAEVSVAGAHTPESFTAELAALEAAGAPANLVSLPAVPHDVGDYDVVIAAADAGSGAALLELTRRVVGADRPAPVLLPVVVHGGHAILGPVSGPAEQPCWVCAQLRWAANSDPRTGADFWRGLALGTAGADGGSSLITDEMLGNALAFEVFRLRSGQLGRDDQSRAVVQDLTTLESGRERVLPHPQCPLPHQVPAGEARPLAGQEPNLIEGSVLVSPRLGLLSAWTDESIKQIPVKTGRVRLGWPGALAGGAREIAAFDVDVILDARARAVLAAASTYAGRLGPIGRSGGGSAEEIALDRFEVRSGAAAGPQQWLAAVSLADGSPARVPAAVAYPWSPANAGLAAEPTSAGAAAGWSVEEVQERGLCSALAYRAIRAALRSGAPLPRVAEGELAADDESAFLLEALRHLDLRPRVLLLPGAEPAHAALVLVDNPAGGRPDWAIGSGLSAQDAVRAGLRDAVGAATVRHYEGVPADLGDPLVEDLDPRVFHEADTTAGLAGRPETTIPQVLQALAAAGTRALYVDTTPVDFRSVGGLVAGTVLLATA
ncbi:MAG TPA: TOMM precursor leader peptide-binding protein [Jatrophihabitans sp.]|nr:TOMM precursor leader peptide-binding protein [Jatrophihabitans sp.]